MEPCTSQPKPPPKKQTNNNNNKKNPHPKKFLIFSEVELSSSNIKKILIFSLGKAFLIFYQKKAFLLFPEMEFCTSQPNNQK